MIERPRAPSRDRAQVPWSELKTDVVLLGAGAIAMVVALPLEARAIPPDHWFDRSGAVAVLFSAIVAYRSLAKHYRKFLNYTDLAQVPNTSKNQGIVDKLTLALSVLGTAVWAYGDILFRWFCA